MLLKCKNEETGNCMGDNKDCAMCDYLTPAKATKEDLEHEINMWNTIERSKTKGNMQGN